MMELMKFDCGGSAAVLGAARAIGDLAPPNVEAHFIVAACENMINDRAIVPSDILTASNGKTIEVMNTGTLHSHAWLREHCSCRK
jgi:leucyl aminopeptidase